MLPYFELTTFQIGPIPIQVWGFFVALGMAVTVLIIWKRSKNRQEDEMLTDIAVWAIVGGLIGARFFHVFLYEPGQYINNPVEILKVWHGGLSSFGGLFGAFLGAGLWAYRKKKHKLSPSWDWLSVGDRLAFAAVYGWMIGRVGCVMIHDHPGIACDCFLAISFPEGERLDMALIEIIAMIPLAIWFFTVRKKPKPTGWYLAILFLYYGALRFVLDFFRATDIVGADTRYFGLTPAQYFSMVLVVLAARMIITGKKSSLRYKSE